MLRLYRNQDTEETAPSFHIHTKDTTLFFLFGLMDVSEAGPGWELCLSRFRAGEGREELGKRGEQGIFGALAATRRTHQ